MVPVNMVPRDQLWFWTPEWQAREREVDDALAQGDFKQAASAEDLFKALRSR
jgi:hypothetical protein